MMTIAEQIYTLVKDLPQDQAIEILAFAEFIHSKHSTSTERNSEGTANPTNITDASMPWTELVNSLAGTWADDFPSLESIRAKEGQDVSRESL